MASTAEGTVLTERHRLRQVRIGAEAAGMVAASWSLLDWAALDESWDLIQPALVAVTIQNRRISARVSADYYNTFRAAEGVLAPFVAGTAADVPREAIETSLRVTGPSTWSRLLDAGASPRVASDTVMTRVVGAVQRHARNGGRSTILGAIQRDPAVSGYHRVTAAKPCYFCAMLASRGAVYVTQRSASFKPHDHCACTAEPAFKPGSAPARSREFEDLWRQSTKGTSGKESLRAFRRAYEAAPAELADAA